MRILDLFCGAGGAARGYHLAFPDAEIVGVDVVPQPRYPFAFVRGDALTFPLDGFDFIHASPPCQAYSVLRALWPGREYPALIGETRTRLRASGVPYIIENVPGADLVAVTMLCGSMFGMDIRRHRYFEAPFLMLAPGCAHHTQRPRFPQHGARGARRGLARVISVHGHGDVRGGKALRAAAMGIDWMTHEEMAQAVPPAYTRYLARFIPVGMGAAP